VNSFRRSGARGECESEKWKMILIYLKMYRKPREEHKNCEKYNGLWVDVTCNLYLEKEFTIGEPEGKIPLGTPRRRREHND